ncbi:heptaprenyl diphosphate synthase component 1 [Paenibacillus oenotherae]|uniref:Heptaprenyl diphosphate synthase component 1 n=1 Tax=Paenibacillus oenotherae TaxID=1435645 RepID=A0ABS7D0P8_9BACL|nr:heptaprenyl diphosphate synthase component 1 [Paenibacillus oenotherae]MBW7473448.1 heptaprenyl diphosphate synthase component 1 [Paenibacillus oenotherae]
MKSYRIPEIAKKYVEYDMIQTYTELPAFPDSRIRLLFAFLANQRTPQPSIELYSLAASLVQLGMDTHEMIDSESGHVSEREMRSRQLKVLAGDYFSSRFYQLLSQAGEVDMIRRLSSSICEVNRLKMNLYTRMQQLKVTAEDYLNQCVQLRTELFQAFTGILDDGVARIWSELLQGIGRCEVVADELSRTDMPERFDGSWGFWHVLHEGSDEEKRKLAEKSGEPAFIPSLLVKYNIRSQLADQLKKSVDHVQAVASRLESDKLVRELMQIGDVFLRPLIPAASVLNERR